jgi:hypothetical protein
MTLKLSKDPLRWTLKEGLHHKKCGPSIFEEYDQAEPEEAWAGQWPAV